MMDIDQRLGEIVRKLGQDSELPSEDRVNFLKSEITQLTYDIAVQRHGTAAGIIARQYLENLLR